MYTIAVWWHQIRKHFYVLLWRACKNRWITVSFENTELIPSVNPLKPHRLICGLLPPVWHHGHRHLGVLELRVTMFGWDTGAGENSDREPEVKYTPLYHIFFSKWDHSLEKGHHWGIKKDFELVIEIINSLEYCLQGNKSSEDYRQFLVSSHKIGLLQLVESPPCWPLERM